MSSNGAVVGAAEVRAVANRATAVVSVRGTDTRISRRGVAGPRRQRAGDGQRYRRGDRHIGRHYWSQQTQEGTDV